MFRRLLPVAAFVSLTMSCWADVPPPPVNQEIGFPDISAGNWEEADCRACHQTGVPNRHHLLYGEPLPDEIDRSAIPYPEYGTDGVYNCLICHGADIVLERDCTVCHTSSPHHQIGTAAAETGECVRCHGDIVDDMDDGHYIPTYAPSLVTPAASRGTGEPLNSRGEGAGACNYCHDDDGMDPEVIRTNRSLHHATGLAHAGRCNWCHDFDLPESQQIRVCENCHGPDSLHSIQADSHNQGNVGTIVVGFEDPGYGHVGNNSDCWGCHGFQQTRSLSPLAGPMVPTIYESDGTVVTAGKETMLILTGAAFTSINGGVLFESDVVLTAADGSSVILTPDVMLEQEAIAVTIPADTAPGNYRLRAVQADGEFNALVKSNPVVVSVVPEVTISRAMARRGIVTIVGTGFGGYAKGSGTSVTGRTGAGALRGVSEATIISWSDTRIKADFRSRTPKEVTVRSVFGTDTYAIARVKRR